MKEVQNFRDNLNWLLDEFGISQRDFADKVDIAYPNLNRILKGHCVPGLDTCERIAEACTEVVAQPRFVVSVQTLLDAPREFHRQFKKILESVA